MLSPIVRGREVIRIFMFHITSSTDTVHVDSSNSK